MRPFAAALAVAVLLSMVASAGARSYVGRKLPVYDFVDTEGREIRGKDYEGSVLVVLSGIPW